MAKPRQRLKGSEGRPWCDKHPANCLMCWCGYLRVDVMMSTDRKELVVYKAEPA